MTNLLIFIEVMNTSYLYHFIHYIPYNQDHIANFRLLSNLIAMNASGGPLFLRY